MTQQAKGDWPQLVQVFLDASPLRMAHWNPQTGEIFAPPRGPKARVALEKFELRLLEEDDWLEVPFLESDAAFDLVVRWVESLDPGKGKRALMEALQREKPFRHVRAVLGQMPGMQRRYQRVLREEAEARLVELCVSMELTLDHPRFVELAPHFVDPPEEIAPNVRRIASLSLGKNRACD